MIIQIYYICIIVYLIYIYNYIHIDSVDPESNSTVCGEEKKLSVGEDIN